MTQDNADEGSGVEPASDPETDSSIRTMSILSSNLEKGHRVRYPANNRAREREPIGSFTILREIGRGGMGIVYEATEDILNRRVALKVLPADALMDEMHIRRFRNEAAAAAQLVHTNIVPVFSVGSDRGVHFYAMQLIEGRNIAQVIESIRERVAACGEQKKNNDTPQMHGTTERIHPAGSLGHGESTSPSGGSTSGRHIEDAFAAAVTDRRSLHSSQKLFKSIAAIGRDVAQAIHYAHENGIVHRDIKPSNLLLDEKGKAWVTDFGLAQIRDRPLGTGTDHILGTLRYMSPEQASGRKFLVDHRTDIYSLGVTLYELFSLKPALGGTGARDIIRKVSFEDPSPLRQINHRIPTDIETIVSKAISKNPKDRYATAAEMAEDLARFCEDQPIAAKRPSVFQKGRRWIAKHQTLTVAAGIVMGVIFVSSLVVTGVIANSLIAVTEQEKKVRQQLDASEGMRLIANSLLQLDENPGLSLALAMEATKRVSGTEVNEAVQAALDASHERRVLFPRTDANSMFAMDPSGRRMVSTVATNLYGKGNYPAILFDLQSATELARFDSGEAITSAVISPDGDFVLTATNGAKPYPFPTSNDAPLGAAMLWDAASGRRLKNFSDNTVREAHFTMFSPDSESLVLAGPGNDATVYSTSSSGRRFVLHGHTAPVSQVTYSANGSSIATLDATGEVRIWSAVDGSPVTRFTGENIKDPTYLSFSADSSFLVVSAASGGRAFGLKTLVATENEAEEPAFWREPFLEVSPAHNRAACFWKSSNRVVVRELADGRAVCEIVEDSPVACVSYDATGQHIAVACDEKVRVYDAATGEKLYELLGHTGKVESVGFSQRLGLVISSAQDGSIRFWSPESGAERTRFPSTADRRGTSNAQFSADSNFLLSASNYETQTLLFDQAGNRIANVIPGNIQSDQYYGNRIVVGNGPTVSIVDVETSRVITSRTFAKQSVRQVVALPDQNSFLVLVDSNVSVHWDIDQDLLTPLTQKGDQAVEYALSKDGSRFLIGTANGKCQLHESATGRKLRTIPHASLVTSVCFLSDDQRIVTVDEGSTIRIWGDSDQIPEKALHDSSRKLNTCFPSTDGQFLITYDELRKAPVCCWSLETGQIVHETPEFSKPTVLRHPSEPAAIIASRTDGLKIWNYDAESLSVLSEDQVVATCATNDRVYSIEVDSGISLQPNDVMRQPRSASSRLCSYNLSTEDRLVSLASTDGMHRGRICVNRELGNLAISTVVHSVDVCELKGTKNQTPIGSHLAPISYASFVGNTHRVVTASWDGTAKVWGEGFQWLHTLGEGGVPILCAAISHDGRTLACGHNDGSIALWEIQTGKSLHILKESDRAVVCLTFDKAGLNLLASYEAGSVRYWNLVSREFTEIESRDCTMVSRLSHDDRYVLTMPLNGLLQLKPETSSDECASLFDLEKQEKMMIPGSEGAMASHFGNRTNRIGIVLNDGSAKYYEVDEQGKINSLLTIASQENRIVNSAFTSDDLSLAVLRLADLRLADLVFYDLPTGKAFHSCEFTQGQNITGNSSNPIPWTLFSPDGNWCALKTIDETRIVPVFPGQVARETTSRILLPNELVRYQVIEPR